MSYPAPPALPAEARRREDDDHLRLLSLFHYVVAAIVFLVACLPLIHFAVGAALLTGVIPAEPDEQIGARVAGCGLLGFSGLIILAGWATAAALVVAGRFLAQRRRWTFCLVVAALSCLFAPLGTVLGVFTIIVLMRESVKAQFAAHDAAPAR